MGERVNCSIYCTDAAQPASAPRFETLTHQAIAQDADGVDVRIFPTQRPRAFAYSPALYRAIGKIITQVDLVAIHSLNLFPQLAAYVHARRTHTPYIVTPHGALDPWLRQNSARRKAINNFVWQTGMLSRAAALHFTTQDEADLVADIAPGVPRYIVPNGVRVSEFRALPDKQHFRDQFLNGYSGKVVLFLGRVTKKKGMDLLLSGFALATRTREALLVVVGPDDENLTPALTRQAVELGIASRVRFIGPLYDDDRRAALASADIWALTSYTENFGIAALEAMAAGLPIVITTAVNIARDVESAGAGCVISLDADQIGGEIHRLLEHPEHRRQLSRRAVSFAERYDWSNVAPALIDMYETVAARS
jgi:glycosyltransferase involved in cell wall biosynthesis